MSLTIGVNNFDKTFKEVFPTLKLDKDMENLLENADVTRISVNHARDFYKIM